jgi:hypothetical protein
MNGNLYELEKELNRRQGDIERTGRNAWKFQEENGETNKPKRRLSGKLFFIALLQLLKK